MHVICCNNVLIKSFNHQKPIQVYIYKAQVSQSLMGVETPPNFLLYHIEVECSGPDIVVTMGHSQQAANSQP